jgi:hypothetical protein
VIVNAAVTSARSQQSPPEASKTKTIRREVNIRESRISADNIGAEIAALDEEEEGEGAVEYT